MQPTILWAEFQKKRGDAEVRQSQAADAVRSLILASLCSRAPGLLEGLHNESARSEAGVYLGPAAGDGYLLEGLRSMRTRAAVRELLHRARYRSELTAADRNVGRADSRREGRRKRPPLVAAVQRKADKKSIPLNRMAAN